MEVVQGEGNDMRIALFSDTFFPQVNGVALTLGRLARHLERRNFPHEPAPQGAVRLRQTALTQGTVSVYQKDRRPASFNGSERRQSRPG